MCVQYFLCLTHNSWSLVKRTVPLHKSRANNYSYQKTNYFVPWLFASINSTCWVFPDWRQVWRGLAMFPKWFKVWRGLVVFPDWLQVWRALAMFPEWFKVWRGLVVFPDWLQVWRALAMLPKWFKVWRGLVVFPDWLQVKLPCLTGHTRLIGRVCNVINQIFCWKYWMDEKRPQGWI